VWWELAGGINVVGGERGGVDRLVLVMATIMGKIRSVVSNNIIEASYPQTG
jgi:hypothetical protein